MHFGAGKVEALGDDGKRVARDVAEAFLNGVENRQERTFQVPHAHMVGKGANKKVVQLDDLDDVYRRNQNVGAKAVRECIFGVLPKALVAEAERLCRETLERGDGVPLEQRVAQVVGWFSEQYGVTREQLEKRIGRPADRWTAQHVASLGVVGRSLKAGESTLDEEFPALRVSTDELAPSAKATEPAVAVEDPPGGEDYDPTVEDGFGQDGGDQ